ncbi:MAG TPA: DUF4276 family protein [Candidatus Hydrogenedentes bacterium]|nr:DUF4276 family protein [Candidatus Hydrogenedentota bacterium]
MYLQVFVEEESAEEALHVLIPRILGDVKAIEAAYPRVRASVAGKARYRDPDKIKGGTWEALERVLQRAGYHRGGLAKIKAAQDIVSHMDPSRNTSRSFQVFREGLLALT